MHKTEWLYLKKDSMNGILDIDKSSKHRIRETRRWEKKLNRY